MDYKILALDLDGTLTTSEKVISPATKEAIINIQEQGKIVVLASGRPDTGILYLAEELKMPEFEGYILSYNGGRILDCKTEEVLYNQTLPLELTKPLYEIVLPHKEQNVDIICFTKDTTISGIQLTKYNEHEMKINRMPHIIAKDFPAAVTEEVNKFLISGEIPALEAIKKQFEETYGSVYDTYFSDPTFLEIVPKGVDKANGMKKLLAHLGLEASQLIFCGDGMNDLLVVEYAGLGVAMENARDELKAKADFITTSNDEDGVLAVIQRFMRT